MPRHRHGWSLALIALTMFLLAEGAALAGGALLRGRLDGRVVVVLGSGRTVSVLVTAGEARLLIAAGDDSTAFGNAWRRWTGPIPLPRVDVLLIAGNDAGTVAKSARDRLRPRWTAALGEVDPAQSTLSAPTLDAPLRFRLDAEISVTVERRQDRSEDGTADRWRVLITRGRTVVAVVPNGAAAASFSWDTPVAALVVLAGGVAEAVAAVQPRAVIVPQAVEGRTLRAELPPVLTVDAWSLRVPPGELARLTFVGSGLRIPKDASPLTPAPPAPGETRP